MCGFMFFPFSPPAHVQTSASPIIHSTIKTEYADLNLDQLLIVNV